VIEPKYQSDKVTLYLGDCLEILPQFEPGSVDLCLTDPPYMNLKGGVSIVGNGVTSRIVDSISIGDPWGANLNWLIHAWNVCRLGMMVFCSHHFISDLQIPLREYVVGLVTWYKRNAPLPQNNVPHFNSEFIWLFKKQSGLNWKLLDTFYDIPIVQAGCFATERVLQKDSGKAAHPTQKPERLIRNLLKVNPDMVIDPFMGSGTTGVACMQTGRKFIGIEIDEGYYKIAEKRIRQAEAQLLLGI